jgi:hypothetical protein
VLSVSVVDGSVSLLAGVAASASIQVRALDTATNTLYLLLEDRGQLLGVSARKGQAPSLCEAAKGICQAVGQTAVRYECVYMASSPSAQAEQQAWDVCTALNSTELCEYPLWKPELSAYFMVHPYGSPSRACERPAAVLGPRVSGWRAMTFDLEKKQLIAVREDVYGNLRETSDANFQVISLDTAALSAGTGSLGIVYTGTMRRLASTQPSSQAEDWSLISPSTQVCAVHVWTL